MLNMWNAHFDALLNQTINIKKIKRKIKNIFVVVSFNVKGNRDI